MHRFGRHLIGGFHTKGPLPAVGAMPVEDIPGRNDTPSARFGLWVWARRKALRRSGREVSRLSGLKEKTLRALETGALPLEDTLNLLPRLARGLELDPACLYRVWSDLVFTDAAEGPSPSIHREP